MKNFLQLHLLTHYPPANLNRDDLGRPKTAKMGGVDRLRISSQSLKRHWRTSDIFASAMAGHVGTRTKKLGVKAYEDLCAKGLDEKNAIKFAQAIAGEFGKLKKEDKEKPLEGLEIEQLVHISPAEQQNIDNLVAEIAKSGTAPTKEQLQLFRKDETAVDIALFGRMLASKAEYNVEAAAQVAHALTVHGVTIENDFFTAVDDFDQYKADAGSSHLGETGFAAGLFYTYICINKTELLNNLDGNTELANKALQALTEAAIKVAPKGKQNSFGSHGYANYVLAEIGDQQPRSLSAAFLKPIMQDADYLKASIEQLNRQKENFDKVYGNCSDAKYALNALEGEGSMSELMAFICE
ncbi:type I-E CRISPR-associated protein Cas7/Cse4/CasC [Sessilibacter sp. MAH1]